MNDTTIKIGHSGDWHNDPSNFRWTSPAIESIVAGVIERQPDLFVFAGDFFIHRGHIDATALANNKEYIRRIANVCPVVVIDGNHDVPNHADRVGSAFAAMGYIKAEFPVWVFGPSSAFWGTVQTRRDKLVNIAAIPSPSKYVYMSNVDTGEMSAAGINERIAVELENMIAGFAAKAAERPRIPTVLVYHGTIAGAKADSEMIMTTGNDIAIKRDWIDDRFAAVMCGHLHHPQQIGNAVYCGAPAPLTRANKAIRPSWCLWELSPHETHPTGWRCPVERIPIPVASQILEFPVRLQTDASADGMVDFRIDVGKTDTADFARARVFITGDIPAHLWSSWKSRESHYRGYFESNGAEFVRFEVKQTLSEKPVDMIKVGQSVDELITTWIEANPDVAPMTDDLRYVAAEIEKRLDPAIRDRKNGSDYRPVRIKATNFKRYADVEMVFDDFGSVVGVTGPNGSGKSNLFEIEAFALYKFLRDGSTLDDVVRDGEKRMSAELEYDADGKRWQIIRTVKITGDNKPVGDVRLIQRVDVDQVGPVKWIPINEGKSRETDRTIEQTVGSLALFRATRYAAQFDISRLLEMQPADVKTTIQHVLNADIFGARFDAGTDEMNLVKKRVEHGDAEITALKRALGENEPVDGLREQRAIAKENRNMASVTVAECDASIDQTNKSIDECREGINAIDRERERRARTIIEFERWKRDTESFDPKIADLDTIVTDGEIIRKDFGRMRAMDVLIDKGHATFIKFGNAAERVGECEKDIRDTTGSFNTKLDRLSADHKRAVDDLERAERTAELIARVPCYGGIFVDADDVNGADPLLGKVDMSKCELLVNATKSRDEIPRVKQRIDGANAEIDIAETMRDAGLKALAVALKTAGDERDAIGWNEKEHHGNIRERDKLKALSIPERFATLETAESNRKLLVGEQMKARERMVAAEVMRDEIVVDDARSIALENEHKEHRDRRVVIEQKASAARDMVAGSNTAIARLDAQIEMVERQTADIETRTTAIERDRGRLNVLTAYVRAMHRDGLPFIILEQSVPVLQQYANEILEPFPISINIRTSRSLRSGDERDGVFISFIDDTGERPKSESSGFQSRVMGVALRVGMSLLHGDTHGIRINQFVFDEVFGSFHKDNLQHAPTMIRNIAVKFDRVVFITHIPELHEIADTMIHVTPSADGSTSAITVS